MKTVSHFTMTLVSAWIIALATALSQPALAQSPTTSMEEMLDTVPVSLDANVSTEYPGFQSVLGIGENLERLYGIGSVYERRTFPKGHVQDFGDEHVPIKVSEDTTLREYLDHMCSDGKMAWGIVQNAIHIWPTAPIEHKETYLDTVRVSLDLQGVSLLDAAKAWATEVNRNRTPGGDGVRVRHPSVGGGMRGNFPTSPSLTQLGAVTLKLDNVTAREALCAIQGMSAEWVRISYAHLRNSEDRVLLVASEEDRRNRPQISAEERAALDAQEDLASVLVEPEAKE